ncbi:hypothetical protein CDO73_24925 [Saccharibacillus sp. O23]|uniref:hypothetical protein n=1 Tax=Saccharibacillus sp. O23 TaxID=2009338 RepID=UPI000B4E6E29|nr:hypothetical protein [Saccharibacillus sp. O23]OWR26758.1 hypothetical protein CDO73_24925 [Saccharibacillus sp. O23]
MPRKSIWIPAIAGLLLLSACSPQELATNFAKGRLIEAGAERYPDQQRPSIGYASGSGFTWNKGKETQNKDAWRNLAEAGPTGEPNEVDISAEHGYGYTLNGTQSRISGKSLASLVERAAAYEYKHKPSGIRIDSQVEEDGYVAASFPYRYKGEDYTGTILAKKKGETYIYKRLNFSREMTDEGLELPLVPGNGSMGIGEGNRSVSWTGGSVHDQRIREVVIHFEDESLRRIPIAEDQATYMIPAEWDREIQYVEGLDADGKSLYSWQF